MALVFFEGALASALEFSQDHPLAPLKPNRKNQMKNQLITRNYNNLTFTFRDDGYFNMTKAAKCFGKGTDDFWRNAETTDYLDALKDTNLTPAHSREYVEAKAGRYGGTWAHPKLAIFFARWLDVQFSVWCDAMIEDLLKGNAGPWWFMGGRWGVLGAIDCNLLTEKF